jgi:hypothetical protein
MTATATLRAQSAEIESIYTRTVPAGRRPPFASRVGVLRPLARLAQEQESGGTRSEARSRTGFYRDGFKRFRMAEFSAMAPVALNGCCWLCRRQIDLLIERDRGQFVPSRRRCMMANVRAECLLKIPAEPSPELRIPGAAAQTRVGSMVCMLRMGLNLLTMQPSRALGSQHSPRPLGGRVVRRRDEAKN